MFPHRRTHIFFFLILFLLATLVFQSHSQALTSKENATPTSSKKLELDVTVPADPLGFGAEGQFTLSVTNAGDETAVNVTVKLPNNRSIFYTGAIAEPEDVVTRGTAVFEDIAPDETVTVDVPIQIRGVPSQGMTKLNLRARGDGGVKSDKEKVDIEIVPFEPEETEMPEEGGEFVPESGNIAFDFPPGWLNKDADITFEAQEKYIIENDETGSVITFDVDAKTNGPPIDEFTEPVTVTFAIDNLVDFSANPALIVRTKEKMNDPWQEIPATVDAISRQVVVTTTHFSIFSLATVVGDEASPDRWNPAWTPPVVDGFNGAATYSQSFQIPPGINGLQPQVTLSYSSRGVDGLIREVDSTPIGHGWTLADISIARVGVRVNVHAEHVSHPGKYRLVLNGSGHELVPQSEAGIPMDAPLRYYVKDQPEIKVVRYFDNSLDNGIWEDGSIQWSDGIYWVVTTADGTQYRLGYVPDTISFQRVSQGILLQIGGHGGRVPWVGATQWHVDTVTDVFGHQMTYEYAIDTETEDLGFTMMYTTQMRLDTIRYNYPETAPTPITTTTPQQSSAPATRLVFEYNDEDGDYYLGNFYVFQSTTNNPITEYRITTEELSSQGAACDDRTAYTRVVSKIQQFSGTDSNPNSNDAGISLPATEFGYTPLPHFYDNNDIGNQNTACLPYQHLENVKNGYGGEVIFAYAENGDERQVGDYITGGSGWPTMGLHYFVIQQTVKDGLGESAVTTYNPQKPCYDQTGNHQSPMTGSGNCGSTTAEDVGKLVGFEKNTQTTKDYGGAALNSVTTTYSRDRNLAFGKATLTLTEGPSGADLHCIGSIYAAQTLGPTTASHVIEQEKRLMSGDGVCTGAGEDETQRTRVEYSYHSDYHGLAQKMEYDENDNLYRCTDYDYAHKTAGENWLVNRPAQTTVYAGDCGSNQQAQTRYRYKNSSNPGQAGLDDKAILRYTLRWDGNNYVTERYDYHSANTTANSGWYGLPYETYTYMDTSSASSYATQIRNKQRVTVYNHMGQPVTIRIEDGGGTLYTQDTLTYGNIRPWLLTSHTDSNHLTTNYSYDEFGRLATITDHGETLPTVKYGFWDVSGPNRTVFIEPLLISKEYHNQVKAAERSFYDGLGRVIQTQLARANVEGAGEQDIISNSAYDARGLQTCADTAYAATPYIWNPANPVTPYTTDACGSQSATTTTTYDALGRMSTTSTPDGNKTTAHYGIDNNLAYEDFIDPNRHRTQYRYDGFGRLTNVLELSGDCTNNYWYGEGFHCTTAHPNEWDTYATTTYSYDHLDNLTNVTDAAGNSTSMSYDPLSRKETMDDPDMGTWHYDYDPAGNLERQEDNRNPAKVICMQYDGLNRLIKKSEDPTPATNCDGVFDDNNNRLATYAYGSSAAANDIGQLTDITWWDDLGEHSDAFTYYADNTPNASLHGLLETQTRTLKGKAFTRRISDYDVLERPLEVVLPNSEILTYDYDEEGADTLASNQIGSLVEGIGYNARGQLEKLERVGNAPKTQFIYYADDKNFRLYRIAHGIWDGDSLPDYQYLTYDAVGNINEMQTRRRKINQTLIETQDFSYDHLDRLLSAENDRLGGWFYTDDYDETYTYDKIGNIESRTVEGEIWDYTYNPARPHSVISIDRSDTINDQVFQYDHNGSMYARYKGTLNTSSPNSDYKTHHQDYDIENRLRYVRDDTADGQFTEFFYDASGQRVLTIQPDDTEIYTPFADYEEERSPIVPTAVSTPTIQPNPLPTDWQLVLLLVIVILLLLVTWRVRRKWMWLGLLLFVLLLCLGRQPLQAQQYNVISKVHYTIARQMLGVRVIRQDPVGNVVGDNFYYTYTDHLGSVGALSDKNGTYTPGSLTLFRPFGEYRREPSTNPSITDRAFTGHRHNDDVGLIYMNARYYLPEVGRFISADTIVPDPMNPQQLNRYTYGLNSPLRFTDPTGHCAEDDSACWNEYNMLFERISEYGYEAIEYLGYGSDWVLRNWKIDEASLLEGFANADLWHSSLPKSGTFKRFSEGYLFLQIYIVKPDLAFEHEAMSAVLDQEEPESVLNARLYSEYALERHFAPYGDEQYIAAIDRAQQKGDTELALRISAVYTTGVEQHNAGLPSISNKSTQSFLEQFIEKLGEWFFN